MTDLYAIVAGVISLIVGMVLAVIWGGGKANAKRDAQDARRETETLKRATEARDAVDHQSDDAVLDRLRKRSGK